MNNYWSQSAGGFCHPDVLGPLMPADAVELSSAEYAVLLDGQSAGQLIEAGPDGRPALVAKPALSISEQERAERYWRDTQLKVTDPLIVRHRDEVEAGTDTTLAASQYQEMQAYRAALRLWPEQSAFPAVSGRPLAPAWFLTT